MNRRRTPALSHALRRARALAFALALLLAALVSPPPALAADAAPDPAVEQRLHGIAAELRCLVCQNESLAGSGADLAQDLRRELRAMIVAGKSDAEIKEFMVSRYGDFVLYRPPLKGSTLLLWFGPALFFAIAAGGLFFFLRRRARAAVPELGADERHAAERLLAADEDRQ